MNAPHYDMTSSTIVQVFRQHALSRADKPAYIFIDGNGDEVESISFGALFEHTSTIANRLLKKNGAPGDRVLLMHPPGLAFIKDFLGILQAGMVAVPAMLPRANEGVKRLQQIAGNAGVSAILTVENIMQRIQRMDQELFSRFSRQWVNLGSAEWESGTGVAQAFPDSASPAFLQYTSGSTGSPKGVIVTHANVMDNQRVIAAAFGHDTESTVVAGWLPLYHDMGLIGNVLQPLFLGRPCILMSSMDFLARPVRWLRAIEKYRATTSGGPNFSYDLCVKKISEAESASIDLSSWKLAFNGAEPVRADTMLRFAQRFSGSGFSIKAFYPCYGLAESTLFVTGGARENGPRLVKDGSLVSLASAQNGEAADYNHTHYVSSGWPWRDNTLRIVDVGTGTLCRAGEIGEIWISGSSVAQGYWGQAELSDSVFHCSVAADPGRQFFRTGDLGFQDESGELFVVGRLKDMIIVRGVNYYAEDIEAVVKRAHPALESSCSVAFSVDSGSEEQLVVLIEEPRREIPEAARADIVDAVRGDVAENFGIVPAVAGWVKYGALPLTSSGKIKRKQSKLDYVDGTIALVSARLLDEPDAVGKRTRREVANSCVSSNIPFQ
jgi:acyl-CoA synthetase (AMP-forming)/AMP-acid ligase II